LKLETRRFEDAKFIQDLLQSFGGPKAGSD